MQPGKFYLIACPWDWTFVGEFVRFEGRDYIIVKNAGYFTRTGATFDKLSRAGFNANTHFHATPDGPEQGIPAGGPWWPWRARTPWVKVGDQ
jgi:hypothetical protein